MESIYTSLTSRASQIYKSIQDDNNTSTPQKRAVIAFAGPPGSGKTTIAAEVIRRLNQDAPHHKPYAAVLPMDGFHYPRHALDALPNREEAHARRGASWTFDAEGVLNLVQKLHDSKKSGEALEVIFAPSFDHAAKDPVENGISIHPSTTLVILEGNWLLLDEDPWTRISELVDDTWFVDVKPDLARERVAKRHLKAGIEVTMEAAIKRAEGNDLINGEMVRRRLVEPRVRVESVEEESGELDGKGKGTEDVISGEV